jgi:hypothetical protein
MLEGLEAADGTVKLRARLEVVDRHAEQRRGDAEQFGARREVRPIDDACENLARTIV